VEPLDPPSDFLTQQRARVCEAAGRGAVVDLACGRGRNALHVAGWGLRVMGIDRNPGFLTELRQRASDAERDVAAVRADLEGAGGLPLAPASCGVLLVFRYLHRPLAPQLADALAPGGLLLYETFTRHQRELGHGPRNPAFLLAEEELPRLFAPLEILEHGEGLRGAPRPSALAWLAARRPIDAR
jgi:SAM-dependent methyltransferase